MNILLLGEYSNFHNTLKKGLIELGHNVVLAGRKDSFKSYPVDISFDPVIFVKPPLKYLRSLIFRLTKFDISTFEVIYCFLKNRSKLTKFDIVQLINEYPIKSTPFIDKLLLKYIFKHNKKVFLSACGDDVTYLNFILNKPLPYHILSPFLNNPNLKRHFKYSLAYLNNSHKKLSNYVLKNVTYIIPTNIDYYMAYKCHSKAKSLIPFPINLDLHEYKPISIKEKIKIFHGINTTNYYKKGNNYFSKALKKIEHKYADKVEIIEVENIPYNNYINLYNDCHILLDQVFSYDQGYNALEAMAKGKVVFTGAEKELLEYYNLQEDKVVINALPDVNQIVEKLSWLIENPSIITEIGVNARAFIEKEHDYVKIAEKYLYIWSAYIN